jgi:hypothetical protein
VKCDYGRPKESHDEIIGSTASPPRACEAKIVPAIGEIVEPTPPQGTTLLPGVHADWGADSIGRNS